VPADRPAIGQDGVEGAIFTIRQFSPGHDARIGENPFGIEAQFAQRGLMVGRDMENWTGFAHISF